MIKAAPVLYVHCACVDCPLAGKFQRLIIDEDGDVACVFCYAVILAAWPLEQMMEFKNFSYN